VACAEGARQMLLGQFRTFGVNLFDLKLNKLVGDQKYASGHYDTFNVASVTDAAGSLGQQVSGSGTNRIVGNKGGLGGKAYRMTVVCSDSSEATHQLEVEFLVNFGF
jgi:hypothetical protein